MFFFFFFLLNFLLLQSAFTARPTDGDRHTELGQSRCTRQPANAKFLCLLVDECKLCNAIGQALYVCLSVGRSVEAPCYSLSAGKCQALHGRAPVPPPLGAKMPAHSTGKSCLCSRLAKNPRAKCCPHPPALAQCKIAFHLL